jgi:hypothetical protein
MKNNERSIEATSPDHAEHEAPLMEEAQAKKKKRFIEPEISVPVDVFEATTFFLFATNDGDTFP